MNRYPSTLSRCVRPSGFPAANRTRLAIASIPLYNRYYSNFSRPPNLFRTKLIHGIATGAGIAVGFVFVAAIVYQVSGWKERVETAHRTLQIVNTVAGELERKGTAPTDQQSPSKLLELARQAAKAYVSGIPLASAAVDVAFDSVGSTIDAHGEEAVAIISQMAKDLQTTIDSHATWSLSATRDVVAIVKRETLNLHNLVARPETQETAEFVKRMAIKTSQDIAGHAKTLGETVGAAVTAMLSQKSSTSVDSPSPEAKEKETEV